MISQKSNINIAIFASGNGTIAESIIQHAIKHSYIKNIKTVVTDNDKAGVITRLKKYDIKVTEINFENLNQIYTENKILHEQKILNHLQKFDIKWVCLAGYMRILSKDFLIEYPNTINIHPSLLPDFKGRSAYEDAFKSGVKESGVSLHFVDSGIDTGPIIKQVKFKRNDNDSFDEFKNRGMEIERKIYPEIIHEIVIKGTVSTQ
jgi:phosphoribosylglycinamide formyltransferase-1